MFGKTTLWRALLILLLALIIVRFGVVGLPKILANHISSDGDESAYLALGLALRESGTLSDGTRPPLYALLLAPFAGREWAYFTTAKLLTLGVGALTILAVFGVGLRLFSWETALLAAFLLAANKEFHVRAATVYADILLALIMVGSWYYLIKSIEGWKYCVWGGVFVGLSFLTKGSAPVLLAAWGLMVLLHYRRTIWSRLELGLVPLAFIITSLPLLIYNAHEFGSPTYNFATQHIMWMDQLAQIDTADPEDLPTFSTYMATHTPADMTTRIQRGLRRLNPVIARSLIPGRDFEPAWVGPGLGLLAGGVLIFVLIWRRPALSRYLTQHKNMLWFTFFLYGLFYIFFTWYVAGSSAETRFVVPLLAPLYLILADVIVNLSRGLGRWLTSSESRFFEKSGVLSRLALALALSWAVWWLVTTAYLERWALTVPPYESDRSANLEAEEVVQWLSRDRPAEAALIAFGPSKSLPLWKFPARFTIERLPVGIDAWPKLQGYLQTRAPDYIIIDDDTARRRREALAGYFQRTNEGVQFEQTPPGWALDFVYPTIPCKWCIFSPVKETTLLATLAGEIELLKAAVVNGSQDGWEAGRIVDTPLPAVDGLIHSEMDSLRVKLTWRTQQPLLTDYTIFVHLTAPDGFIKTQVDQPPFAGARPTSGWQPGEVFTDRYDLPIDESLTPGDYLLLAGMYDPTTGERLEVIEGPTGPAPTTVLLGSVRVE